MNYLNNKELEGIECCPGCGGKTFNVALVAEPWNYAECSNCGLVFTNPRYSESTLNKLYAEQYYQAAEDYQNQQVARPTEDHMNLAKRVKKILSEFDSCHSIDVGCGGGRLVEAFALEGFDASGIEPNTQTVETAKEAGRNISTDNLSDLSDNRYECVTAIHVLEHVILPKEFLAEVYRILKPDGVFVVEVPNFGSKASKIQGKNWNALHPGTHLFHFTPETLSLLLKDTGFKVIKTSLLGGAGIFTNVSESVVCKNQSKLQVQQKEKNKYSFLRLLWKSRRHLTKITYVKQFVRWANWEFLKNGEYVQIMVKKS